MKENITYNFNNGELMDKLGDEVITIFKEYDEETKMWENEREYVTQQKMHLLCKKLEELLMKVDGSGIDKNK